MSRAIAGRSTGAAIEPPSPPADGEPLCIVQRSTSLPHNALFCGVSEVSPTAGFRAPAGDGSRVQLSDLDRSVRVDGRPTPSDRLEGLAQVATVAFGRFGYRGTRMADVGAAAGMSSGYGAVRRGPQTAPGDPSMRASRAAWARPARASATAGAPRTSGARRGAPLARLAVAAFTAARSARSTASGSSRLTRARPRCRRGSPRLRDPQCGLGTLFDGLFGVGSARPEDSEAHPGHDCGQPTAQVIDALGVRDAESDPSPCTASSASVTDPRMR